MSGAAGEHEFLTTRELATLLRVRERKVYDLAAAGDVPCSRATGKLLFRRSAVEAWLAGASSGPGAGQPSARPAILVGSHDPLLDWALRESGAELATYFDGSHDGVERFAAGEAVAAALHLPDADDGGRSGGRAGDGRAAHEGGESGGRSGMDRGVEDPDLADRTGTDSAKVDRGVAERGVTEWNVAGRDVIDRDVIDQNGAEDDAAWNVPLVRARFAAEPIVLIAFARRQRGFVLAAGEERRCRGVRDLVGRRVVPRQAGAGGQVALERLVGRAGLAEDAYEWIAPARTEHDAALAVAEGRADVAYGLQGPARQLGLAFVPIESERFDLLVDRRSWFEAPLQRLAAFCRTEPFRERAATLGGYDATPFGTVRYNGGG